jgi:MFS family permease
MVTLLHETLAEQSRPIDAVDVTTYRQLFSFREFRALFAAQLLGAGAMTAQSLALSVLIYGRTGSPLLAAVAYLGGYVPQALGAATLSSVADRVSPRVLLVGSDSLRAASFALIASNVLPVGAVLAVVMTCGLGYGAVGGVRYLVLNQILPADSYILGRSALTIAVGGMQILGYALSGILLTILGPVPAMWIATGMAATAVLVDRAGLHARPPLGDGRPTVAASWQANRRLLSDRRLRRLLAAQWLPNGLIVGAEALYVPYAGHRAAILFIASAAGMLVGDLVVGRWVAAAWRPRLSMPLYLLLAAPYLVFIDHPGLALASGVVAVASLGYGGTLGMQQLYADSLPAGQQGQAFSLASAGQLSAQGLAAWLAGGLAEALPTGAAIAAAAALSILASVVLLRGLAASPDPLAEPTARSQTTPTTTPTRGVLAP